MVSITIIKMSIAELRARSKNSKSCRLGFCDLGGSTEKDPDTVMHRIPE